jgi:hypothetical protein
LYCANSLPVKLVLKLTEDGPRVVPVEPHEQPSLRIGVGDRRGVVAVHGVVLVRVDATEQPARVLLVDVVDDLVQLLLAAVELGGQQVLPANLALEVKRHPALGERLLEVAVVRRQRLDGARNVIVLPREVGDPDHEQVAARDVHREPHRPHVARGRHEVEEDLVRSDRHHRLVRQSAFRVDGHDLAVDAHRDALADVAADHADAAAVYRDRATREVGAAIECLQGRVVQAIELGQQRLAREHRWQHAREPHLLQGHAGGYRRLGTRQPRGGLDADATLGIHQGYAARAHQ